MALSNKGNFMIGATEFVPKSLKIGYESLASEDSGRTDDGVMHIDFVRPKMVKLEIEMPPFKYADRNNLISLVQGKIYNITFFDPDTNSERTVQVYTSNSSLDMYSGVLYNGLYNGFQFNAIEV